MQSEEMLWGNKNGIVIVLFTFGWCVVYKRGFSCERCVQTKCVCVASEAIYHWGMNRMVLEQWQLSYIYISKLFQTKMMNEQSPFFPLSWLLCKVTDCLEVVLAITRPHRDGTAVSCSQVAVQ